ncbi:MAG: S8 family serine peptidase [Micrococcales bacterium]
MTRLRSLLGLVAALVAVFTVVTPVQAADNANSYVSKIELAHGLIVRYQAGVSPIALDGLPTGANAVRTELSAGYGLGQDLYTVDFANDVSYSDALTYAAQLRQDPRVAFVNINRIIGRTSLDTKIITIRNAITPATAVQALKVSDAWSAGLPGVPRVQLTWKAPKSLFGAKLAYYAIEYSSDAGKSWLRVNGTTATKYILSTKISAGTKYSYRVRAVTKVGSAAKLGAASASATFLATAAPQSPTLTSTSVIASTSPVVTWLAQTLSQRGGLPVIYTATARADGQSDVVCQSTSTTCTLVGLVASANYKVTLVAKNSRGEATGVNSVTSAQLEPMFGSQWYLSATTGVNVQKAWGYTKGSPSVVVAVIDSGITKHPDLDSQLVAGYDFVSNGTRSCSFSKSGDGDGWDSDPSDPGDYYTDNTGFHASSWHGTHVAGIIAAAQNDYGISGIAPNAKIQPIRALGPDGGCSADLIAALNWAAGLSVPNAPINKTPAKVINLSMGTSNASSCDYSANAGSLASTGGALAALKAAGVTTITAAGNSNTDANDSYPGNCFPTINVGATGISQDRSWYSNYTVITNSEGAGVGVDISAPGGDDRDSATAPAGTKGKILSDLNDGQREPGNPTFGLEEGTSMAAPVVAGVVALLYSVKPNITFDQVYEVLKNSVTKFKPGGDCASATITRCGVGIVNAGNALEYLVTHG